MNISRKNGKKFFGSLILSGTILNSVGISTALAMEAAPPIEFLIPKPSNNTYYNIKNSDLYKYIEKTISLDELEVLGERFVEDDVGAKSEDELLKAFSTKSLRFFVITNELGGSSLNSEESGKINRVIQRVWRLRLNEISEHYKKIFGKDEKTSPEDLCLKFLNLDDTDLNKFKLKKLFDIQSLFCKILGEKYVMSEDNECKLNNILLSNYLRIFKEEKPETIDLLSQKDLRKILKNLLSNFPKLLDNNVSKMNNYALTGCLFYLAGYCSTKVKTYISLNLIAPWLNKQEEEFTRGINWFKQNCIKLAMQLDENTLSVVLDNNGSMMDINPNDPNPCLENKVYKIELSEYIRAGS